MDDADGHLWRPAKEAIFYRCLASWTVFRPSYKYNLQTTAVCTFSI